MEIIIIVAMADNRVIGAANNIPWNIPEELKIFKETTLGYPVIMGRRTHDSIGFALPGRKNVILSRNKDVFFDGCHVANNIKAALTLCYPSEKIFILGGENIFKQTIPIATHIFLTVLDREVKGDTFFPQFDQTQFQLIEQKRHQASEPFTIYRYKRLGHSAKI